MLLSLLYFQTYWPNFYALAFFLFRFFYDYIMIHCIIIMFYEEYSYVNLFCSLMQFHVPAFDLTQGSLPYKLKHLLIAFWFHQGSMWCVHIKVIMRSRSQLKKSSNTSKLNTNNLSTKNDYLTRNRFIK